MPNTSPNKPLTLKSVSKILGVSTATISNAFNRPDQLSEKLREKILKQCNEIGYHGPNLTARSLRKGESGVIGVLLSDPLAYYFTDPVANQFLTGISEVLEQNHKQLLMLSGADSAQTNNGIEALPDGFIIYGSQENNPLFNRVLGTQKPIVTVDFDLKNHASINIDNKAAAKSVADYALSHCKDPNIAILGLRLIHSDRVCRITDDELFSEGESVSRRRLTGYLEAISQQKQKIASEYIWHIPHNTHEFALKAAKEALSINPMPNCILCMSDVIAGAVLSVARDKNIEVPKMLKVVGFDDIPEASRTTPALTTVCQKSIEKGRQSAHKLIKGELNKKTILPTELIKRATVENEY
ncbi:LacI family DNA-binding transcriptional regulator [Catenovulum maritimum]|uniref:LacI family transcriptional regulator n=1 Tax=Catenovulum maritimum TaxID=1513271 RepID=A0A0J8H1S2_9ALTE|nr:LacI family DNA-binding transcriptional regulator [Catenovulum maritimum]KMT66978.1 LacI family transcriptional regulator [Catenovulum maritimum]